MGFSARHAVLKIIEPRERPFAQRHGLFKNLDFARPQRLQLPVVVVNDSHRAGQPQVYRPVCDAQRIFGIFYAAPQHRIDVHLEVRVERKQLELVVQRFEAFLGNFIRHRVVNTDLQVFQSRVIQFLNAVVRQQEPVCDHSRDHPASPNMPDYFIQLRMQQRLSPADRDDGRSHARQNVQALLHLFQRHRRREIVEFIAVRASQVAAAGRNDVHQEGMLR